MDKIDNIEAAIEDFSELDGQNTQPEKIEKIQEPINLYIVIDKKPIGMLTYLREHGIAVSNIFESILDAKNTLILQGDPCRLVIMETGTGRFTATSTRHEIVDIIGLADEETKVTVFYTDKVIKSEAFNTIDKRAKKIDWIKYLNTLDCLAHILMYKESYILTSDCDKEKFLDDNQILSMQLTKAELKPMWKSSDMLIDGLSSSMIEEKVLNASDNLLPSFEIKQ